MAYSKKQEQLDNGLLAFSETYSAEQYAEALEMLREEEGLNDEDLLPLIDSILGNRGDLSFSLGKTHEPVSIEQFIEDDFFLGLQILDKYNSQGRSGIYYPVFEAIKEIVYGGFTEALFTGAIGTGKTTASQIVTAYNLYRLSCEVSPHSTFRILPNKDIYLVCLNITDALAKSVTFAGLRGLIEDVPYFNEVFPYDKGLTSILRFPKRIVVAPFAAYGKKVLGKDVIGGIVDELNFMSLVENSKRTRAKSEFDQAKEIYTTLARRLKSRFDAEEESVPACICLVSSKSHPGDFTETRENEARNENAARAEQGKRPLTFIFDKPQWEVKPNKRFEVEGHFYVEIGSGRYPTRVLKKKKDARADAKVIKVPMFFYNDFVNDPEGALKDFAGIAPAGTNSYFYDKKLIWNMATQWSELKFKTPFVQRVFRMDQGFPDVTPKYVVPHPDRPRAVHIDLALSGDSVGLACGFVYKLKRSLLTDAHTGEKIWEEFPYIAYDTVLLIRPPKKGQIELAKVRALIYFMRDQLKIPIKYVTYDGFQSADTAQALRRRNFKTDYVSVESIDVYAPFRTAMFYHSRIACPECDDVFDELGSLVANFEKRKIDHPSGGSKDGADAMAGVYTLLMRKPSSWHPSLRSAAEDAALMGDDGQEDGELLDSPDSKETPTIVLLPGEDPEDAIARYHAARGGKKKPSSPPRRPGAGVNSSSTLRRSLLT